MGGVHLLFFSINRQSEKTLTQQVYEQVRYRILTNEFQAGDRLPSSRELAANIGVSRNVILEAYDQLIIEGYIEVIPQSGTYVSHGTSLFLRKSQQPIKEMSKFPIQNNTSEGTIDFKAGNPAMDFFPRKTWGKLTNEVCLDSNNDLFGYNPSQGVETLRVVLTNYLSRVRGVNCHPEQLFITSGATQGIYLITKFLTDSRSEVIVEDPISNEMLPIFTNAGVKILPVPVDENGIKTELLPNDQNPKFTFVVPSHQFPLGGTLPIQRRIQLIEYARAKHSYIIEDDYDSEFTYEGIPVPSIQGLDPDHVIYVGSFSKILSPSLRMGYLVLPWSLVELFREKRWFVDRHTSTIEQMVLARFIQDGYLDRHIRKMKSIYKKRRMAMVSSIRKHFNQYRILGNEAGMHADIAFATENFEDYSCLSVEFEQDNAARNKLWEARHSLA